MLSDVLLWVMLILPAVLTVYAVVLQRGLPRFGILAAAFFAGWFLVCWQVTASLDEYNANRPKGSETCGLAAGLAFYYGWISSGIYVTGWAALTYAGIGIAKLVKYLHGKWKQSRFSPLGTPIS